jgi:hypothetical protein
MSTQKKGEPAGLAGSSLLKGVHNYVFTKNRPGVSTLFMNENGFFALPSNNSL